jgi:hypothetical protein|tara:strand:- start:636 stop:788 length:153 start_codon:yes stop_codon:yes gene_type:complete
MENSNPFFFLCGNIFLFMFNFFNFKGDASGRAFVKHHFEELTWLIVIIWE